jgi:DNA-binding TFAR19-related protein (PDSD5 family)
MADQVDVNAAVLHQLELVRRDLARVETRLGELVSTERYTIEHDVQTRDLAKLESRVTDLEKGKETMRHIVLSAFLFPLLIAFIFYVLTSGA